MKTYRRARETDAESIATVGARAWRSAYRGFMPGAFLDGLNVDASAVAWRRGLVDDDLDILIVERDAVVAGFCCVSRSSDPDARPNTGELAVINVDPQHWRTGVGSALLTGVRECAKRRSFAELTLWVLEGDPRARHFYEARGFVSDQFERVNERWGFPLRQVRYRDLLGAGAP